MRADQPNLRLSDAERQEALDALSEHVRSGRLDLVEFEDRSGRVATARRRHELVGVFVDLPEPRPAFLVEHPVVARPAREAGGRVPSGVALVAGAAGVMVLSLLLRNPLLVMFALVGLAVAVLWLFGGRRR
ncbi:protein of unknown function [Amycolatopsis arida]|uniref:DUF1707 domain-containing protein n=1 Tax=Amycolatopsis arida TaxID=587909 RepID=A0A1I5WQ80_9PSEU|nr:DUF1707 domain-containing protein [Amycolatopsis arida]TDX92387.1 uncharacterized protein DUF1707 [Amycolatopsis arida]SFQ21737.1 protein of unknown function [Amycolatopsis arida]